MAIEAVICLVGGVRYAVPMPSTREVLPSVRVVPIPRSPRIVLGVFDLRGRLVPLVDLRARFGHAARPVEPEDRFLLVQASGRAVAFHVDGVLGMARMDASSIEPVEDVVRRSAYVSGVGRLPDGLVLISDPDSFLDEAESTGIDDALRGDA